MNAPMPRQSLFPGAAAASRLPQEVVSTSHLTYLNSSLQSLQSTVDVLSHTNNLLSDYVHDVPRLITALSSKRHYDVVTESKVNEARKQLQDEVAPHLAELIRLSEQAVVQEEADARRARNKVSQLSTRLEQVLGSHSVQIRPPASKTEIGGAERAAIAEEQKQAADLQRVRKRRQQLEKELGELEAEVERQELEVKLLEQRKS